MASVADISISVFVGANQQLTLELTSPRAGSLSLPLQLTVLQLEELRRTLGLGLQDLVARLAQNGRVTKAPAEAAQAIGTLYAVGAELGFGIFGRLLPDAQAYFGAAWKGWARAGEQSYVAPHIELVGSLGLTLPLEFVPLFNMSEPVIRDVADLLPTAARFPIFSTIVSRATAHRAAAGSPDVIENGSALLVRLFLHAGLLGAGEEQHFFESAPGTALRGPWPDRDLPPPDFVRQLANRLKQASDPGDPSYAGLADHIQHFMCHCDTEKSASRDYTMTLAHRAKLLGIFSTVREQSATLAELHARLAAPATVPELGPLIFLNACGSSKITPEGVASFPGLFFELGSRGVIGTEIAVPDYAAAEFARNFYTSFLEGRTLGEAMYEARIQLLRDRFNLVGALYSAHANPDLRLRSPPGRLKVA